MINYVESSIEFLKSYDPEISEAINMELSRQRRNLELIASENIVSPAVMAAMGSVMTNKYAEGYPGKRYYGGCQYVDVAEELARKRACELLEQNMQMFSLTPELKLTRRFIFQFSSLGTPF